MRSEIPNPRVIALAALALGVWGDRLFFGGGIGINIVLWVVPLLLVMTIHTLNTGGTMNSATCAWLMAAAGCALIPSIRAAGFLAFISMLAMVLALAMAGLSHAGCRLRELSTVQFCYGWLANGAISTFAFPVWLPVTEIPPKISEGPSENAAAIGRGLILSTPLAIIFLWLFASADVQYFRMLEGFVDIEIDRIIAHGLVAGIFGWIAIAFLVYFFYSNKRLEISESFIGDGPAVIEVLVVLIVVTLVFASYVFVQVGYLFGGQEYIFNTPDLTVAQYARRGFFESAVACALVIVLLHSVGEYVDKHRPEGSPLHTGVALVLVALSLIVVASAFQRIMIYTDLFGLTRDRFYVYVGLTWMNVCFLWIVVTTLLPIRKHFFAGAFASAYVCLFVVAAINPDGYVARYNVHRLEATGKFDHEYIGRLSVDAIPVLVRHQSKLGEEQWAYIEEMRYNATREYEASSFWAWNLGQERSIRTLDRE